MMYAVVDCDNCYVSCERVFHPELGDKPVVVLSNNDGCVVARSNEAKRLGIKAGTPYYQLATLFPGVKIAVFSSNYELYGELTGRVMTIISKAAPAYFRYSIDEAFCLLDGVGSLKAWGEDLHRTIMKCVGIPVSIGIAPTKTLAKMASHFAKHYPGYRHCCLIDSDEKRVKALKLYPVEEVWGVGRRLAAKIKGQGDTTAYHLAQHTEAWARQTCGVTLSRTIAELNGMDCIPNEKAAKKKSICTSRSFAGMLTDMEDLRTHVANHAMSCSEKLRQQGCMATTVGVFILTNRLREDMPQYDNYAEMKLLTPSDYPTDIVKAAMQCLERIYRPGYHYKKAGVVVTTADAAQGIQTSFLDFDAERFAKLKRLSATIDRINKTNGRGTIMVGTQKSATASAASSMRSKNPTTRWSDIIVLR